MKLHLLLCILGIFISCATTKDKAQTSYEYDAEKEVDVPVWVYDINDQCESIKYLCASSEGESFDDADLKSKKALASILKVEVKASSQIKRFGLTTLESKGLEESIQLEVEEKVKVILNGVKILNRFKKDKAYYSYAVLDKKNAVKILKDKIKSIDAKLVSIYTERKRVHVNRLLSLLSQRNAFKSEVLVLDGNVKRSPVSFEDIYGLKKDLNNKEIKIKLGQEVPKNLLKKIEEELTSMGFVITKNSAASILNVSFSTQEEYLNVKGFKKFSFLLNIESFDSLMNKKGVMAIRKVITGRNHKNALSSVIGKMVTKMKLEIGKLNI